MEVKLLAGVRAFLIVADPGVEAPQAMVDGYLEEPAVHDDVVNSMSTWPSTWEPGSVR